jgi:hypothetical protein
MADWKVCPTFMKAPLRAGDPLITEWLRARASIQLGGEEEDHGFTAEDGEGAETT